MKITINTLYTLAEADGDEHTYHSSIEREVNSGAELENLFIANEESIGKIERKVIAETKQKVEENNNINI